MCFAGVDDQLWPATVRPACLRHLEVVELQLRRPERTRGDGLADQSPWRNAHAMSIWPRISVRKIVSAYRNPHFVRSDDPGNHHETHASEPLENGKASADIHQDPPLFHIISIYSLSYPRPIHSHASKSPPRIGISLVAKNHRVAMRPQRG